MYRNKELLYYGLVQIIIIAFFVIYGIWGHVSYLTLLLMGAIFICINIIFMYYRYKKISQLNTYLQRIQNQEYTLDIRDNKEGELSILKNEIYKITKMLSNQAELLQRDKRYLSDSISDISHQLKTPLTSLFMMIEFLEYDDLPSDKRKEFISNITKGLSRMEWLIQSLLKLSKLDAEAVVFKNDIINIKEVINHSLHILKPIIEERYVDIIIDGNNGINIYGDSSWLIEAFTNILKNCVEHMKSSTMNNEGDDKHNIITINISQNNLYTKIDITDNGVGIDKEDIPYIFERFYKGKNSKSDSVGIGLALSKQIIHRHRGNIEVRSEVGKGTTFEIKIYGDKSFERKVTKLS